MCGQVKRGDVGGRASDWWGGYAVDGTSNGRKEIKERAKQFHFGMKT